MSNVVFHGKECLPYDLQNGNSKREEYIKGICDFIESERIAAKNVRDEWASPEKMAKNREFYREKFLSMIGSPEFPKARPRAKKEKIGEDAFGTMYSMQIEVLPNLWFYGILSLPFANGKLPFVIAQHGGSGTPEICSDMCKDANYSNFTKRALEEGFAVFAPSLALWSCDEAKKEYRFVDVKFDRADLDKKLKQLGLSITGLEVFFLRRVLDYFCTEDYIDTEKIGMMGVSYGGYFSLHTAAADTRIKAIYAAAFFNDRDKELFSDWGYFGAEKQFFDAEVAGLCAPRKVFLDVGKNDRVFDYHGAVTEEKRARAFYSAAGVPENLSFHLFDGGHSFGGNDERFSEFFRTIKE